MCAILNKIAYWSLLLGLGVGGGALAAQKTHFDSCPKLVVKKSFSTVPLIRELQKIVVARHSSLGYRRIGAFDPRVLFGNEAAMALLIDGHPKAYEVPQGGSTIPQYLGIEALVDQYEADSLRAGIPLSGAWTGLSYSAEEHETVTGKRRFIRRLFLELAYAYQSTGGVRRETQPRQFTQSELDLDWSLLPCYAEMVKFFGNVGNFQDAYRGFARARLGVKTPYQSWVARHALRPLNRIFRELGLPVIHAEGAMIAVDAKDHERREMVENAVREITDKGEKRIPLSVISTGIGADGQQGSGLPSIEKIASLFSFREFVERLNEELEEQGVKVVLGDGVPDWEREWLIQEGVALAGSGTKRADFRNFQIKQEHAARYIAPAGFLFLQAKRRMDVSAKKVLDYINSQVRLRLPE